MTEPEILAPAAPPNPVIEFHQSLKGHTPRVFVTYALIGVNVAVYAAMVAKGVDPTSPTIDSLLAWGADYAPRTLSGEPYRAFTAMFLHIGALHLAMNMFVLWSVGRFVERLLGNAGFLILYIAAGLTGSLVSLMWAPYVVSAGASGAIFGLYGAILGFLLRGRDAIPRVVLAPLLRSAFVFIGYNVLYGASQKGIDMAAHFGGLGGGFVGGLLLSHPLTRDAVAGRWRRNLSLAALSAITTVAALFSMPKRVDVQAEFERMASVESESLDAYNGAIKKAKTSDLSDAELADVLDSKVIPPWRTERERLATLKNLPSEQAERTTKLIAYMQAREDGFQLMSDGAHTHDSALVKKGVTKVADAAALMK